MNIYKPDSMCVVPQLPVTQLKSVTPSPVERLSFGARGIDDVLEPGLPISALHEIYAANDGDMCSASLFALLMAIRSCPKKRPIFWVRDGGQIGRNGRLYPPGMAEYGIDPDRIIYSETPDTLNTLRAGVEAARCAAASAVLIEVYGNPPMLDLTASRRLSLAAQKSGVLTLLLRFDARQDASAAFSRWQVASAPSTSCGANAPGMPAFDVSLLRHRGGVAGLDIRMEWNRDRGTFKEAPLSGDIPAVSAYAEAAEDIRQAG